MKHTFLAPFMLDFPDSRKVAKNEFLCYATRSVVFCCSSQSRIKQYFRYNLKDESKFACIEETANGIRNQWIGRRSKWRMEKRNHSFKDNMYPMFIAELFGIANTWKQPECPSIHE